VAHLTRPDGKLTIRDRAALLVDPESFLEQGPASGVYEKDQFVPGNFLLGTGLIGGQLVVVGGEDFAIKGGSPNLPGLRKSRYCEQIALELRAPLIRLHEGAGGSITGAGGSGAAQVAGAGKKNPRENKKTESGVQERRSQGEAVSNPHRFRVIAQCLDVIPVASAVLGSVAGLPAIRVAASHFAVMLTDAVLLVGGARVVEQGIW